MVGSCLYGVDINPLAVELAKLSLWLTTVERGRPLSFLDHHLRCGNSLIGARLEDLPVSGAPMLPAASKSRPAPQGQLSFLDLPAVRASMQQAASGVLALEAGPEETPDDVHGKATRYQALRGALVRRYGLIADLAIARRLGLDLDEETFQRLVRGYLDAPEAYVPRLAQGAAEAARRIARAQRVFHWELEFPQAFSGLPNDLGQSHGGFQAVVGNPPYVRQETLGDVKQLFEDLYEVFHGSADLYAYFIERGIELLAPHGHFTYVVSNKWLRAGYGEPLRRWLKQKRVIGLVDFGSLPVFGKVSAYPCILHVGGGAPDKAFQAATVDTLTFENLAARVRSLSVWVDRVPLDDSGWALVDRSTRDLLEKMRHTGVPLEDCVQSKIYRGVITGLNEAFVIDADTRQRMVEDDPGSADVLKPFLAGRDIKRYCPPRADNHLVVFPKGWTRQCAQGARDESKAWEYVQQCYPAIAAHLARYEHRARGRLDKGDFWWELRACDYYQEFKEPKVVWPNMLVRPGFTVDIDSMYVGAPACSFAVPLRLLWVLTVLNSSVMDWFMRQTAAGRGGGFVEYKPMYVRELSLPIGGSDALIDLLSTATRLLTVWTADSEALEPNPAVCVDLERDVDQAIYQLYGLSRQEIGIIEAARKG